MNAATDRGLVLHVMPWRETSLIVEAFTREHGRLGMIAKGARRPRSALRGLLQPFQLLDLRWAGKSELRTLIAAEWVGGLAMLSGSAIMPGFYLNELMVRLLPREDPHPVVFDDVLATLGLLARQESEGRGREMTEPILRRFECNLLRELGVAPNFDRETASGTPVAEAGFYQFSPQSGVIRLGPRAMESAQASSQAIDLIHGRTLLALARSQQSIEQAVHAFEDPEIAAESKRLLRALLGQHLGEDELHSRQVMRDLVRI